jgi:hypothetical protein
LRSSMKDYNDSNKRWRKLTREKWTGDLEQRVLLSHAHGTIRLLSTKDKCLVCSSQSHKQKTHKLPTASWWTRKVGGGIPSESEGSETQGKGWCQSQSESGSPRTGKVDVLAPAELLANCECVCVWMCVCVCW